VGWVTLLGACAWASALIVRDLWRGKHSRKSAGSIAGAFYAAAGVLLGIVLIKGLGAPHDPASTFNAVYLLAFVIVCLGWALENRMATSELKTREHLLRIECRLADLVERTAR